MKNCCKETYRDAFNEVLILIKKEEIKAIHKKIIKTEKME